ncbi:Stage II sporulation E [Beggiatoa sp. PS]|nr:Stage II sporulation E [Beggiatoa sp. PS]
MQKSNLSDKDMTIGFVMFAFVKVYQDSFISSLPKLIKIAYENGLLLRYGFLIIGLSIYSLLSYLLILASYFLLKAWTFSYHEEIFIIFGFDQQTFYLLRYAFFVLTFVLLKQYFQNANFLYVIAFSLWINFIFVNGGINIYTNRINFFYLPFSIIGILYIILLYDAFNNFFKKIHFTLIFHTIIVSSPSSFLVLKDLIKLIQIDEDEFDKFLVMIIVVLNIVNQYFMNLIPDTYFFIFIYILLFTITISLFANVKNINLISGYLIFIVGSIFMMGYSIIFNNFFEFSISFITVSKFWINSIFFIIILFLGLILIYFLYKAPSIIVINFFPHWWFTQKYKNLFSERSLHTIFRAFTIEPIPVGRKFILQIIINLSFSLNQKIDILAKMVEHEKMITNSSQSVLDEIYKIRQTIRQEQRQAELTGDVSPVAQNSFKNVTGFDFSEPTLENHHYTALSPIDSARQQLLDWLKGKTPANPSIDKLLVYQWQDYEIGIGLKYSGQMGGDFYDLFQLPTTNADNQVGVVISDFGLLVGDLTGHGVETALNLSKTHNFWAETDLSQDVLTTMQAFEQNFKTTFHPFPKYEGCELCYLQLKDNEITLSRAGLHLGLIQNNQWHNIAPLPDENFGSLGKWPSMPVKRYTRIELKPGETLIVYTDGLFENANQNGDQFGQEKFQQLLLQHQNLDMNTLIDTLFEAVYEFCQPEPLEDDETLLIIRRISSTTDLGE